MRRLVIALLLVGLSSMAVAITVSVQPELATALGFVSVIRTVENAYFLSATIAGFGIFYALYVGMSWWLAGGVHQVTVPPVEQLPTSAVPGTEFDRALPELAGERGRAARPVGHREHIRERLTVDAVRTVARVHNLSEEAARERVETGAWTANRYASRFLGGEDAPGPTWYQRLVDWLLRRDPFTRGARQTVVAIEALAEAER